MNSVIREFPGNFSTVSYRVPRLVMNSVHGISWPVFAKVASELVDLKQRNVYDDMIETLLEVLEDG